MSNFVNKISSKLDGKTLKASGLRPSKLLLVQSEKANNLPDTILVCSEDFLGLEISRWRSSRVKAIRI